jgi:hypothetical protein
VSDVASGSDDAKSDGAEDADGLGSPDQPVADRAGSAQVSAALREAGQQLHEMVGTGEPSAAIPGLARQLAATLERTAGQLDHDGLDAVVGRWLQREPGGLLVGAAVAGFVAGRMAPASERSPEGQGSSPLSERPDAGPSGSPEAEPGSAETAPGDDRTPVASELDSSRAGPAAAAGGVAAGSVAAEPASAVEPQPEPEAEPEPQPEPEQEPEQQAEAADAAEAEEAGDAGTPQDAGAPEAAQTAESAEASEPAEAEADTETAEPAEAEGGMEAAEPAEEGGEEDDGLDSASVQELTSIASELNLAGRYKNKRELIAAIRDARG